MAEHDKGTHGGAREGAGRPKLEESKVLVNVRLTKSEKELIKAAAAASGVTPSTWMREAILKAL